VENVAQKISPEAKIIWGAMVDKAMGDTIRSMLIVTGVKSTQIYGPQRTFTSEKQKEIEKILGVDFIDAKD